MSDNYSFWNVASGQVESVPFNELFSEVQPDFTKYSGGTLKTGYLYFLGLLTLSIFVILLFKIGVSDRFRNRTNWEMFMEVTYF